MRNSPLRKAAKTDAEERRREDVAASQFATDIQTELGHLQCGFECHRIFPELAPELFGLGAQFLFSHGQFLWG